MHPYQRRRWCPAGSRLLSVKRSGQFANAVDAIAANIGPEARQTILRRDSGIATPTGRNSMPASVIISLYPVVPLGIIHIQAFSDVLGSGFSPSAVSNAGLA
jgi:hypothetical protein